MRPWKRLIVIVLVCLNLGLLLALIHVNMAPAQAAAPYRTTDYVIVTGKVSSSLDGLFVIDLASQKLAAFTWDKTAKRMRGVDRVRDLDRDFRAVNP